MILYDAARCPYCARVRIVLAEKRLGYEPIEIDLSDRPAWLYEKNPRGKVPVLEAQPFLSGRDYGLADIAYVPWILRARSNLGVDLEPYESLSSWLGRLGERSAIAAELEVLAAL